jgi:serine/threonine-protein kinase
MDLKIGQLFDDKYEILKVLGQGGMGKVYLTRNIKLGTLWAIKQVDKQASVAVDLLAEPNIMKQLKHPKLPRIFDILDTKTSIFIIVDYVEGESLNKVLTREGKISESVLVEWAKQICDVFIYLHEHHPNPIIYRDMKPSNLMKTPDGEIRVIDFGIAREYKKEAKTDTQVLGTAVYAAPEQRLGMQTDERSDIYSLGVTLYQLATGESPSAAILSRPIRKILPTCSEGFEEILGKMLRQDPDERYQNARELLSDFENIQKMSSRYKRARRKRRMTIFTQVACVFLFFFITLSGFSEVKAEKMRYYKSLVQEGNMLAAAFHYATAQKRFNKAIHYEPQELNAYQGVAKSLYLQRKYDEETAYIKQVSEKLPEVVKDPQFNYLLGTAYLEQNNDEDAVNFLRIAAEGLPTSTLYNRDFAVALARDKKLDDAQAVLKKMQTMHMADEATWYVEGEIESAEGSYDQAVTQYRKVVEKGNDDVLKLKSVLSMADLYKMHSKSLKDQHIDQRITVLKEGLRLLPKQNPLQIHEMLAEAYHDKGLIEKNHKNYYRKSIEQFKQLLSDGYQRPYVYRNIAIIEQEMNEYSASEKTLLAMKKKYPHDYTCYIQLALLYADMENNQSFENRDYSKVWDNYQKAVKYSPNGKDDPQMAPLNHLIDELKAKKWIK